MDLDTKFHIDVRAFNEMLDEYKKVSSRSLTEILNNKAYYIAVNALNYTKKANIEDIRKDMGRIVTTGVINKRGKAVNRKVYEASLNRSNKTVPLAALIVNAKLRKEGQPPVFGEELNDAMRKLYASRVRSISFVRASWIPAIKRLSALVKKSGPTRPDTTAKKYGQDKGGCQPALVTGSTVKASIWSDIHKTAARISKNLQEGLRIAYQKETMSMAGYIKNKMDKDTAKFAK